MSLRSVASTAYKRLPLFVRRGLFRGDKRYCPVCESQVRKFVSAGGTKKYPDARCPVCGSEERHRIAWLYLVTRTDLLNGHHKRFLHVGPLPCLQRRLEQISWLEYTAADLAPGPGVVRADIRALPFADGSFEMIWCCHVLEHVVEDVQAMRELRRVLVPEGCAVVQVPINSEHTIEGGHISDPDERERMFGQADHVRSYGSDFVERLREAGFSVEIVSPSDLLSADDRRRMAIPEDEDIYVCSRQE